MKLRTGFLSLAVAFLSLGFLFPLSSAAEAGESGWYLEAGAEQATTAYWFMKRPSMPGGTQPPRIDRLAANDVAPVIGGGYRGQAGSLRWDVGLRHAFLSGEAQTVLPDGSGWSVTTLSQDGASSLDARLGMALGDGWVYVGVGHEVLGLEFRDRRDDGTTTRGGWTSRELRLMVGSRFSLGRSGSLRTEITGGDAERGGFRSGMQSFTFRSGRSTSARISYSLDF